MMIFGLVSCECVSIGAPDLLGGLVRLAAEDASRRMVTPVVLPCRLDPWTSSSPAVASPDWKACFALHAIAGDSVRLSLVAPDPDFSYRPLAVAEPFALGHAHRVPLSRFAEETSAELVIDAVVEVGDGGGEVRLHDGRVLGFEALLLAPGGRAAAGLEGATTWWPGGDSEDFRGLLRDIDEGYTKRLRSWCRPAQGGRCPPTSWRS